MKHSALEDCCRRIDDGPALCQQLAGPFARAIRLHPRRGSPSGWDVVHPVPWSPAGRFHDPGVDPASRLDYHTGLAYPQDAASQLPVLLLDPQAGERLLDCCAAPGSKSTQIGLALGDAGLLVCCDASAPRRRTLRETLARQGVACALITALGLDRLGGICREAFDGVLVDAPCSGHADRSLRQVDRSARRQAAILDQAAALVRAGGRLVYSTCTPYWGENEAVIHAFLARHPTWRVEPQQRPGCDPDLDGLGGLRLWPQRQGCEPFFACLLRRGGAGEREPLPSRPLPAAWRDAQLEPVASLHCWAAGDFVFAATPAVAACALSGEARGLLLGRRQDRGLVTGVWAEQALIERGAPARTVSHAEACRLWAGEALPGEPGLLRSEHGVPLAYHDGRRLRLPSRLTRPHLC